MPSRKFVSDPSTSERLAEHEKFPSAEAIRDLAAACGAAGMPLVFTEAASSVLEKLTTAGVAVYGLAFPTVDEACVNAILKWKPAAPSTSP
jgi:hypothetical protein